MATSTASVTTDTTNYTRIHLILMKGGTLLTKTLFLKRVKDLSPAGHEFTVDEFLGKHRVQILSTSTGRNNEEKLYPPTGTSTNLDEWDLPLYCFILKTVCGLPNINKLDMEILKTMRNELAHLHDPSLTDADFKSHLITIEPIFARSFHMINDPSFEKEMKALLQKCETGALAVDEVVKVHHDSNRKHIELLSNQVKMMKTQVDMIKNQSVMLLNQTTHQEKIDSALSMLTEIKDRLPPNPDVDIPDVHVIIEVKNCTKEKEKELLDFLVKQFDETISDPECTLNKDFPDLAMYTISEAICKTFKSFLEKGRHLLKVENGSICLTVKCNSISSFVGLIRDYIDGKLLDHLTDLKDAIQKWDGFSYIDFDLIVSPDEITEAILKLAKNLDEIVPKGIQVNVPPDELSSSTMFDPSTSKEDTLTSCSTSSIFRLEIKPETDDQRTEIEKCFSSGSISERFEQCQRQLRKDPHFTNVEIEAKLLAVDSPRTDIEIVDVIERKNGELLDKIVKHCERTDREGPEVIMLIGRSGAGKSALINTIHKVITGEYYQIAKQGSGHAQSVTLELGRYDNCGVKIQFINDDDRRQKIERVIGKLPRIFDCVGLGDVNTQALAEILELLVGGFIAEDTQIEALEEKQKQNGIGSLKRLFKTSDPQMVVTKVVFVQGCRDEIPKQLIECLNQVLKITDPQTLTRKYTPEVFLLLTKYDLVRDPNEPQLHLETANKEDDDGISLEEFERVEKAIAPLFNIVGALGKNRIRWASITDRVDKNNQYIENIALKFLERMVEPGAGGNRVKKAKPVLGFWQSLELEFFRLLNVLRQEWQLDISPAVVLVIVLLAVVLGLFYKLLSTGV